MSDKTKSATDHRREVVDGVRRVVVKVGTRLLTDMAAVPKGQRIRELVAEVAALRDRGLDVIVVSSGAIGAGMLLLNVDERPTDLSQLQALAAIGQSRLMSLYEGACQEHGFHCAQLLLSAEDFRDRKRHLNVRNCLHALLQHRVLPIINENDTVSVDEITFGDNDRLAALVAAIVPADLTILLTSVDGLRERTGAGLGKRVSVVTELAADIRAMAGDSEDARFSTGGMLSKLEAAAITMSCGEHLWIADGRRFGVLREIFTGADVGTLFLGNPARLTAAKRYLAFCTAPAGTLTVDAGAVAALHRGASLLPIGIREVAGTFEKGDMVTVRGPHGSAIAQGISNYASDELERIKGCRTPAIRETLGHDSYGEAIHRDNMVVWADARSAPRPT